MDWSLTLTTANLLVRLNTAMLNVVQGAPFTSQGRSLSRRRIFPAARPLFREVLAMSPRRR